MALTGFKQQYKQEIGVTSTTKLEALGTLGITKFGDLYRYTLNGAVALAAGKTIVPPAAVANHTTITVQAAAAVGDTQVSITLGATAATQDQYQDGTLTIKDAAGLGQTLRIRGNTATASAGVITVYLSDPLTIALTTSSIATLSVNDYNQVVVATTTTPVVVGVPQLSVPANAYFWAKVHGKTSILSAGVIAKGARFIPSTSVAAAVTTEGGATVTQVLGWAGEATIDTKYDPLFLNID